MIDGNCVDLIAQLCPGTSSPKPIPVRIEFGDKDIARRVICIFERIRAEDQSGGIKLAGEEDIPCSVRGNARDIFLLGRADRLRPHQSSRASILDEEYIIGSRVSTI